MEQASNMLKALSLTWRRQEEEPKDFTHCMCWQSIVASVPSIDNLTHFWSEMVFAYNFCRTQPRIKVMESENTRLFLLRCHEETK